MMARFTPFGLIACAWLAFHGLLLTNDGTVWDGWFVHNWLKFKNWPPMIEFFGAVGMPLFGTLYRPFAFAPDIIAALMMATSFAMLGCGMLTYVLARDLTPLSSAEALAIALLSVAMPAFTAGQDLIMIFFILAKCVFLASAVSYTYALCAKGFKHYALRLLGAIGFYFSFTNSALLVFYGGIYLLFFLFYRRQNAMSFRGAAWRFPAAYPELLLLPPLTWVLRGVITPQFGWYADYNNPFKNIPGLPARIWSFFDNVPIYHFFATLDLFRRHAIGLLVLAAVLVAIGALARRREPVLQRTVASAHLVGFGLVLLLLSILPYAAAGKRFSMYPVGDPSRYCLLTDIPLAILLFGFIQSVSRRLPARGYAMPLMVIFTVLVLGCQIPPIYLAERVNYIYARSILQKAVKLREVEESAVVVLQSSILSAQTVYGTYGFATAFGELTRLVTAANPENSRYFTAREIEELLLQTTVLPTEYMRVNPAGRQVLLRAEWSSESVSTWDVVRSYLQVRWFGSPRDVASFLDSLCTLRVIELKPATSLSLASDGAAVVPAGARVNSLGMRMIPLKSGLWAAATETTQEQYETMMASNPSMFKDPLRPVECVTWNQATEFCAKLTEKERLAGALPEGFVYRLPSSAEFDLLAANTSPKDAITADQQDRWSTAAAGSSPPNSSGVHDGIGNVWEWCLDWDDSRRMKISRGGGWTTLASDLAVPATPHRLRGPQRRDYPTVGFWDRGFRCILAPPVEPPLTPRK